jgi:hypothetical protein
MRRVDLLLWLVPALACSAVNAKDDAPAQQHAAEIVVTRHAPFVVLPLDVETYRHSEAPGLADLRIHDARGERVPFALLPPPAPAAAAETSRDAPLYALPPRKPGAALAAPVELRITAGNVTVVQRTTRAPATAQPPGWLVDLGDDAVERAKARRLELRLGDDGAADFSAAYRLESSADLQRWSSAGSGQLLRLGAGHAALTQDRVALPASVPRFVRIVWDDAASAPKLAGARVVLALPASGPAEAPSRLALRPTAPADPADGLDGRALLFDLGGTLPITQIDLDPGPGTRVAPVTLQLRARAGSGWLDWGRHAFWRLEREDRVSRSEPVALHAQARYVRVVGDERAARLDPATTQLIVHVTPASLVLATQGTPLWKLLAGDARAQASALPIGALVPDVARERERFGSATLGAWSEIASAAQRARDERRRAALRPWLLWGVLVAGVAVLGVMAWRLVRPSPR